MREADVTMEESEFEAMGIGGLLSLGRDAGLQNIEELACHGSGAIVQAAVDDRFDEAALSSLECVDRWDHVAETEDAHVYVIAFTAPGLPDELDDLSDELVGTCDPELGDGDAAMSLVGPQGAIAGTIDEYERAGLSPTLQRLGSYEGPDRPLDDLTDRQREVIETAHELGYYEVPKQATTDEVAAELELDDSTVSEHLQRAERNLLGRLLE